jgi:GNAT superfamily N-acetyltransferase
VAIFYDGAKARELDVPLERAAAEKSGDSNYSIPTEPETSEFYLDALSVSPRCQRKGYGSKLIEAGCDRACKLGHHRIALLIEVDNAAAKPLYERLGFCTDYTKRIVGQEYFHMVEFVMYQGTRAVLQSGKNFQVPAMIADVGPGPRVAVVVSVVEICRRLKIAPATTSVRYFLGGGPRSTKSSNSP